MTEIKCIIGEKWLKKSFNRNSTSANEMRQLCEKKKSKMLNKKWDNGDTKLLCVLKVLLYEILLL